MLEVLRIHDLALIEDIEMEFATGMNVLTGETGAGKSFILKALHFLTGDKMGTDLVRPGKEKAVVEALFIVNEEEVILRRELAADTGRSRLYLNDRLCSQEVVRDMRASLMLHTSQHGQQKLLQASFQAKILDDFLHRPDLLERKDTVLQELAACVSRKKSLEQTRQALEDKREVLEYQQQEIEKVSPKPHEEEELEERRTTFRNQAGITENAADALSALHGDSDGPGLFRYLSALERPLSTLAEILDDFSTAPESLLTMRVTLQDLESALRKANTHSREEADIEAIESRLYKLAQLKRKLKRPLQAILSLQQEITENLDFLDNCQLEHKNLAAEETEFCDALAAVLAELNPARQATAATFSTALQEELKKLGFSEQVRVFFEFSSHSLHVDREDCKELRAHLMWQPNPGQPEQPLDRIASGGELSRFLLAVVTLMSKTTDETPTLIFDEVDSGVGGLTLNRVADSLNTLAAARQMLLITHWPQLASRAARHFVIQKEIIDNQTFTRCTRLDVGDIQKELVRMAGGESEGNAEESISI